VGGRGCCQWCCQAAGQLAPVDSLEYRPSTQPAMDPPLTAYAARGRIFPAPARGTPHPQVDRRPDFSHRLVSQSRMRTQPPDARQTLTSGSGPCRRHLNRPGQVLSDLAPWALA
jgi:hypothetical protein